MAAEELGEGGTGVGSWDCGCGHWVAFFEFLRGGWYTSFVRFFEKIDGAWEPVFANILTLVISQHWDVARGDFVCVLSFRFLGFAAFAEFTDKHHIEN